MIGRRPGSRTLTAPKAIATLAWNRTPPTLSPGVDITHCHDAYRAGTCAAALPRGIGARDSLLDFPTQCLTLSGVAESTQVPAHTHRHLCEGLLLNHQMCHCRGGGSPCLVVEVGGGRAVRIDSLQHSSASEITAQDHDGPYRIE